MALAAATRVGPYEVVSPLGSGGMGEVYRARDVRLGREVALKVLPERFSASAGRLERLRREATILASLNHPHVATLYGLEDSGGAPVLVMELVEGETLSQRLLRGALGLPEALECARQIAEALEAAHEKGILHRDLKPANVRFTAKGQVKLLDFGLAKALEETGIRRGTAPLASDLPTEDSPVSTGVSGTAPYMSPEQARGEDLDRRTDVWSFGCVVFEMLSGRRAFGAATAAEAMAAVLEKSPPWAALPEGVPPAVRRLLGRCLEKGREKRLRDMGDVRLEIEELLSRWRRGGASLAEPSPYPGLRFFAEEDAGRFFGREAEVLALWRKVAERSLLALIGPSGAGKTSLVRAGVLASRPSGWGGVVCTPGSRPYAALAQALAPALAGDAPAVADLVRIEEPEHALAAVSRWRHQHVEALLVVDQLEELFTLNPPEVQERFAELLGRIAAEAGVHVLLSMRDDFLIHCHEHPALAPVFSELTPLLPLKGEGLHRALVEPAAREGYRFEDEALVDEMVGFVAEERGALPLLAFAVAKLWDRRDTERRLLTRQAYEEIGGVGGALAQHAETTLEGLGPEREPTVREIFRNLVTAEGTRAAMEREELLSAFGTGGADAGLVLDALVDARLLTEYEAAAHTPAGGGVAADCAAVPAASARHRYMEIVHESLLGAWPRLVRWRTQDADGAQLRDQLRQAAHLWAEKGRTSDILWTGSAYREFELWRERYPGALTALEEDFARSMTDRARRKRRAVRVAAAAAVLVSSSVAIAIAVSRHQAVLAARRAEASKLLALAQLKLQDDPTEALAYTTASLELADTKEARMMALRSLQEAPPAWELQADASDIASPVFSPDGRHLGVGGFMSVLGIWSENGGLPLQLPDHESSSLGPNWARWASTELLVTGLSGDGQQVYVWSVPGGRKLRTIDFGATSEWQVGPERLFAEVPVQPDSKVFDLRSWRLPNGEAQSLGRVDAGKLGATSSFFEPHGRAWFYTKGTTVHTVPLPVDLGADRVFSRHAAKVREVGWGGLFGPDVVALHDESGENRLLRFPENGPPVTTIVAKPGSAPAEVFATSSARWVRGVPRDDAKLRLWDETMLAGARPLELRREGSWHFSSPGFHFTGRIVVATTHGLSRLTFWPLPARWPSVVDGYKRLGRPVAFSPDSRWLATTWTDGRIHLWPLPGAGSAEVKVLGTPPDLLLGSLAFDPKGRYVFATGLEDNAWIVPLDGAAARKLDAYSKDTALSEAAVSPTGRRVATAFNTGRGEKTLRVWDVETGAVRLFDLPVPSPAPGDASRPTTGWEGSVFNLAFLDDSTLYTAGHGGIRRWNLDTGATEVVKDYGAATLCSMVMSADRRVAFTETTPLWAAGACGPVERLDLATGVSTPLPQLGDCHGLAPPALVAGMLAAGDQDGLVRVGRESDREAHLLVGHVGPSRLTAVSSDLKWVASAGEDNTLRLWPMPDLSKPPLHTLPHDELVAKLKSFTNLCAVRDSKSTTGWSIELGPFPGWKNLPTW